MGNTVEFQGNEQKVTGYLALPDNAKGPGVLVLHAWWGLNSVFKTLCDRLASEGFVAFAPDLFHGQVATTIDEAHQLSRALDEELAYQEINACIPYLLAQPQTQGKGIGVIGFSLGSSFALSLEDSIAAIVTFYGISYPERVTAQAPIQGHFAENDEYEPVDGVRQFEQHLRSLGKDISFTIYPGTRHWFFEENRPEYDANAAKQAWDATVQFLRKHLAN